jgi:hypothetical protein
VKNNNFDVLIGQFRNRISFAEDKRKNNRITYTMTDCAISGLAMIDSRSFIACVSEK